MQVAVPALFDGSIVLGTVYSGMCPSVPSRFEQLFFEIYIIHAPCDELVTMIHLSQKH